MLDLRIVPDVLHDRPPCIVTADTPVRDAARRMGDAAASAALVLDTDGSPCGLISERDLARRIVAEGRDAVATPVAAILRAVSDHLAPGDLAVDALALMAVRDLDCLPVMENGAVVGLVTLADLCNVLRRASAASLEATHVAMFQPDVGPVSRP